ncbi:sensor domain-containing diguanylate cyclase [Aquihabitans sp. G128]|uniref:sensor domain-containing diguanylate cyclase n=1 Tax=Aquihabitans sp. G128 TaxID=2849779 RepID=UPI001C23CA4A|nr:sensor domain-containing diguanylate cyclase [Aquihabitans sp. G128]QXC59612.1 sensor domain-containing diguanylate cyclase [Aquihabitans sp. G128]
MARDVGGVERRRRLLEHRASRHAERTIQHLRLVSLVPAAAQVFLYPGSSRALSAAAVVVLALTCAWVELATRAEDAGRFATPVVWTSIVGDVATAALIMVSHRSNPGDAVQFLPLLMMVQAAARWDRLGGIIGGAVAGAASAAWSIDVHHRLGIDLPAVAAGFRVVVFLLVGSFAGMLVREANEQRRAAEAVFTASRDLVVTFGLDGRVRAVNPASQAILGYAPEELVGLDRTSKLAPGEPIFGDVDVDLYRREGNQLVELRLVHRDGHQVWLEVDLLPDLEAGVIRAIGRDVSDRRRAESELRHRVDHDGLTGLCNRDAMVARLNELFAIGRLPGLIFVDLDRFKAVNDEHGHVAGDRVLREIADRLARAAGPGDVMVARYAGDEFCVVVDDPSELDEVLARVRQAMELEFDAGPALVSVSASFGAATARSGERPEVLVHRADQAMYAHKSVERTPSPTDDLARD